MTAGQDEARAQSVVYGWMGEHDVPLNVTSCMALIDAVRGALSEARGHGARDRDAQIIEACRQKGNGGVPFITELTAKLPSAAPDIFAESAKNAPALAPNPHLDELTALSQEMGLYDTPDTAALREAVPDGVPVNRNTGRPCDHSYVRNTSGLIDDWTCDLCGNKLAALSSAQGSTTEGRDG